MARRPIATSQGSAERLFHPEQRERSSAIARQWKDPELKKRRSVQASVDARQAATDYLMEIFAEVRCGMKTAAMVFAFARQPSWDGLIVAGVAGQGISAGNNGPTNNAPRIENARVEKSRAGAGARRGIAGVCAAVGATAMDRLRDPQVVGNREVCCGPRIVERWCGTCPASKTATTAHINTQTPP